MPRRNYQRSSNKTSKKRYDDKKSYFKGLKKDSYPGEWEY
jgi:hypothetical protein